MRVVSKEYGNGYEKLIGYSIGSLVTIIVPAYNHEAHISECIRSIIGQTYKQIEVIFIDDGSIDMTYELGLEKLRESDFPYLAIKKINQGSCVPAINSGIGLSHGEFISILASDDIYFPEKVSASIKYILDSDAMIVVAKDIAMEENGKFLFDTETSLVDIQTFYERGNLLEKLYQINKKIQLPYLGLFFKKDAFDIVGLYDPMIFTEDLDMLFRIAISKITLIFLNQIVGAHRTGIRSTAYMLRAAQSSEIVFRRYAPSFGAARLRISYSKISQAEQFRNSNKKSMLKNLFLGIIFYPPILLYIFERLLNIVRRLIKRLTSQS